MVNDPASDGWHLDRRVPLALIISIFTTFTVNLALGVWFVADIYHTVENIEGRLQSTILQVKELDDRSDKVEKSIIELQGEVRHGNEILLELKGDLKTYIERQQDHTHGNNAPPSSTTNPGRPRWNTHRQ